MKIALITDTHWGVRNDSPIMHNQMKRFLDEVFFPTLDRENISTIIHLGDLVDRRKYINFVTSKRLREDFLDPICERGIDLHIIAGNHDTYYKNTNRTNSLVELIGEAKPYNDVIRDIKRYPTTHIYYEQPCTLHLSPDDPGLFLIPWIADDNRQITLDMIRETTAPIALGHLELNGFEMYKGHISDHGDSPKLYDKFDVVCSGHYHTKSSIGNIHYLGSPCQFTWTDYGDSRGFHVLDTSTRDLNFFANPYSIFHKLFYDDLNIELDTIVNIDFSIYKDTYVKVIIRNKTNPYWFDMYIDKLEKAGVLDLQVVEDHFHLDLEQDQDIVDEAEDTITILNKYIDGINSNDNKKLKNIFYDLYNEAMTLE